MAQRGVMTVEPDADSAPAIAAASALIREVYRTYGALRTLIVSSNADVRLAPLEAITLGTVVEEPVPVTVAQVARLTGNSRQAIQRAAGALQAAGLIETASNPGHKRSPLLLTTAAGRAAKSDAERARNRLSELLAAEHPGHALPELAARLASLRASIETYAPSVLHELRRSPV